MKYFQKITETFQKFPKILEFFRKFTKNTGKFPKYLESFGNFLDFFFACLPSANKKKKVIEKIESKIW